MLSYTTLALALLVSSSTFALPTPVRREVPQEHSHEPFLTSVRKSLQLNNPLGIADPVFGLLGNAAASQGLGKFKDPDCLQQATADQAFTNAKKAKDVQGQVDALIYRALERNTGKVGLASVKCTSTKAVNPEIAAIQQHQDPASANAKAVNKAIVLELAKQIKSVGGNPQDALLSGTFAPGDPNDPTGKGNTCDDQNDPKGCIFSGNLLVKDATPEEIDAAVKGTNEAAVTTSAGEASATQGSDDCAVTVTVTVTAQATETASVSASSSAAEATGTAAASSAAATATATASASSAAVTESASVSASASATASASASASTASASSSASSNNNNGGPNLQGFTQAIGNLLAPAVKALEAKLFKVDGSPDAFVTKLAALTRSCDIQHNLCADAVNSGKIPGLSVNQCDKQNDACKAAMKA